jgi:hypothetical protein
MELIISSEKEPFSILNVEAGLFPESWHLRSVIHPKATRLMIHSRRNLTFQDSFCGPYVNTTVIRLISLKNLISVSNHQNAPTMTGRFLKNVDYNLPDYSVSVSRIPSF